MALISLDEPNEYSEWAIYITETLGTVIFCRSFKQRKLNGLIFRTGTIYVLDFGLENCRIVAVEVEFDESEF